MPDRGSTPVPAIRTDGLTKRFGSFTALDSLTLEVGQSEVFGFLGPNGAGKSTTLRLLLGLIRPTAGERVDHGIDVADVRAGHRHLAYVTSVEGVASVDRIPTGLRVTLNGSPAPLLRAIADLPITNLRSQEASLEEIFLGYYGEERDAAG